jgi:exonuclease SbcC
MSDGRYRLCWKEVEGGSSVAGLALDVFDAYTHRVRDVQTLSGGESFVASMVLALGFADTVQARSGGVQLDTLFIDEGFGSLDDDSLRLAIATLQELTDGNRLVGIISHVGELKTKIDKQIIVTKALTGGSRCKIVES